MTERAGKRDPNFKNIRWIPARKGETTATFLGPKAAAALRSRKPSAPSATKPAEKYPRRKT